MQSSGEMLEYDGSFAGFLCCVYDVFKQRRLPEMIFSTEEIEKTLFVGRYIETDEALAKRVDCRLRQKLSSANLEFIRTGFLTKLENKEVFLLKAFETAFQYRDGLEKHTYLPEIHVLYKAIRALWHEAHFYVGFARFSEVNGYLLATIEPKHFVLPNLLPHFIERFPNHPFGIYDQTHQLFALVEKGKVDIQKVDSAPVFHLSEDELRIQEQWRTFFKTVSIKERENKRRQLNQLPKRYQHHLTEFYEEK